MARQKGNMQGFSYTAPLSVSCLRGCAVLPKYVPRGSKHAFAADRTKSSQQGAYTPVLI